MSRTPHTRARVGRAVLAVTAITLLLSVGAASSAHAEPTPTPLPTPTPPGTAPGVDPNTPVFNPFNPGDWLGAVGGWLTSGGTGGFDIVGMVVNAVTGLLGKLVEDAAQPLLDMLGKTLLATPDPSANPSVRNVWETSLAITAGIYGLFILAGGVTVMAYESVQTRYAAKQIGPRLITSFLVAAASMELMHHAVAISNAVAQDILGEGVDGRGLVAKLFNPLTGGLFLLLLVVVQFAVVVAVLLSFMVRTALVMLLAACAPLALACHASPATEGLARLWWRAFGGCLAIQLAQAVTLIVGVRTLYGQGDGSPFGFPTASGLGAVLAGLALFYILFKTPSWATRIIFQSAPRRSGGGLLRQGMRTWMYWRLGAQAADWWKSRSRPSTSPGSGPTPRGGGNGPRRGGPRRGPGGGGAGGPRRRGGPGGRQGPDGRGGSRGPQRRGAGNTVASGRGGAPRTPRQGRAPGTANSRAAQPTPAGPPVHQTSSTSASGTAAGQYAPGTRPHGAASPRPASRSRRTPPQEAQPVSPSVTFSSSRRPDDRTTGTGPSRQEPSQVPREAPRPRPTVTTPGSRGSASTTAPSTTAVPGRSTAPGISGRPPPRRGPAAAPRRLVSPVEPEPSPTSAPQASPAAPRPTPVVHAPLVPVVPAPLVPVVPAPPPSRAAPPSPSDPSTTRAPATPPNVEPPRPRPPRPRRRPIRLNLPLDPPDPGPNSDRR
ncbi:hypothetical protein [Yinghuangia sp. YIM S09857]|uniref:hypothetical protein n=1 Tax=Yinghuangia sp. YIM S09857 TaxID=3436929 RepID=UPI003F52A107